MKHRVGRPEVIASAAAVDVLVNDAGVELSRPLGGTSSFEWDRVFGVNVSSISGLLGRPESAAYCASKGAVIQLTRQKAIDYVRLDICVNCMCPGKTLTPMIDRPLWSDGAVSDRTRSDRSRGERLQIARLHPLVRSAAPEEIGEVILFLTYEEVSFVTGAVLPVEGGFTAN